MSDVILGDVEPLAVTGRAAHQDMGERTAGTSPLSGAIVPSSRNCRPRAPSTKIRWTFKR